MITISCDELSKKIENLYRIDEKIKNAVAEAVNISAEEAKVKAILRVQETYDVKAEQNNIKVRGRDYAVRLFKARASTLTAYFGVNGRPIPLIRFNVTPTEPRKQKVIVSVKKSGGKSIDGAFIARLKSGHIGVFIRAGKSSLPIKQLYGPSVPQMFGEKSIVEYMEKEAKKILEDNVILEVNKVLD